MSRSFIVAIGGLLICTCHALADAAGAAITGLPSPSDLSSWGQTGTFVGAVGAFVFYLMRRDEQNTKALEGIVRESNSTNTATAVAITKLAESIKDMGDEIRQLRSK